LGIEVDALGPRLVACLWLEDSPVEIGGYLVVDNLAMGRPSMGGIRILPDLAPAALHSLARGMTLKNAAANLPYGGGKSGIVSRTKLSAKQHEEVVQGFARLLFRYRDIYLPGPDVGTNDADMKTVAIENGLDMALSKPADMGGNRVDEVGAAAEGVVIALEALLHELPRLRSLPQFVNLRQPVSNELTILIQGFGAVGANTARFLHQRLPNARVVGISDASGYLYDEAGLPVERLYEMWQQRGLATQAYFLEEVLPYAGQVSRIRYSNDPNGLLRESAFCLIPAAPISNYLDTDPSTNPSMTVDRMGRWALIMEGANTYSPDSAHKAARTRMERAVYRQQGIMIATDYLVNSGGVIFAAQEKIIKTPGDLRIPEKMLGDRKAVTQWLSEHAYELHSLAEKRQEAGRKSRDEVLRKNMKELVDLLVSDADMLPCETAERISIRRIASRESDRVAADLMETIITIPLKSTVLQAAKLLVEAGSPIMAVINDKGELAGVVTEWDITRAAALGSIENLQLEKIMSRKVVSASPNDTIIEMVRKLEYHEISAMPVVKEGSVLGMISADLLARRTLVRLLYSQTE